METWVLRYSSVRLMKQTLSEGYQQYITLPLALSPTWPPNSPDSPHTAQQKSQHSHISPISPPCRPHTTPNIVQYIQEGQHRAVGGRHKKCLQDNSKSGSKVHLRTAGGKRGGGRFGLRVSGCGCVERGRKGRETGRGI